MVVIADVSLESEPAYGNTLMQFLQLRWGRLVRVENLEDTQALAAVLRRRAEHGESEAVAVPITDPPP